VSVDAQNVRAGRRAGRGAGTGFAKHPRGVRLGVDREMPGHRRRFIDTDYNEESFFVRHAYFLGAKDPYGALKTTLKAEIDKEAWATLRHLARLRQAQVGATRS